MNKERAPYDAGAQPAPHIDEYNTRRLGPDRFEVYRILGGAPGGMEVHYCECKTVDAAVLIARALNLASRFESLQGEATELETTITWIMRLRDGSRITITVDALATEEEEGQDQTAAAAYYLNLLDRLNLIGALNRQPLKRGKLDTKPMNQSED